MEPSMEMPKTPLELTEREKMIAQEAARLAVNMVTDEFYKQVGKSVVTRLFIFVGVAVIGFGVAKGWIRLGA